MANAQQVAVGMEAVAYMLSLIDQLAKVRALVSKEGGATKEDFATLVAYHESERKRIGDYVDALPDEA